MGKTKKAKDTNSVIKWSPSWLVQLDFLKSPLKEWCRPHTTGHALCIYDNSVIDFGTQGFHALFQHSKTQKHKDSTVKGLRIVKEFVRKAGGAHNVKITPAMRAAVRDAYQKKVESDDIERKKKEANERKRKLEEEASRKEKEELESAERKKSRLEKKEAMLAEDEEVTSQSMDVAQQLLREGQGRQKAIADKDLTEVELASSMIHLSH